VRVLETQLDRTTLALLRRRAALYTTDLESGFAFYNKLFGWTKLSDMDVGTMASIASLMKATTRKWATAG
jgi:hypothetical protein